MSAFPCFSFSTSLLSILLDVFDLDNNLCSLFGSALLCCSNLNVFVVYTSSDFDDCNCWYTCHSQLYVLNILGTLRSHILFC
jgi:hypothetical protein